MATEIPAVETIDLSDLHIIGGETDEFIRKFNTQQQRLQQWSSGLSPMAQAINAVAAEVAQAAESISENTEQVVAAKNQTLEARAEVAQLTEQTVVAAEAANQAAQAAQAVGKFEGFWSLHEGPALGGRTYAHNNKIWLLTQDVAEIQDHEPANNSEYWIQTGGVFNDDTDPGTGAISNVGSVEYSLQPLDQTGNYVRPGRVYSRDDWPELYDVIGTGHAAHLKADRNPDVPLVNSASSLEFHPSGHLLIATSVGLSAPATLQMWHYDAGRLRKTPQFDLAQGGQRARWSEDGRFLGVALSSSPRAAAFELNPNGDLVPFAEITLTGAGDYTADFAWSPDGRYALLMSNATSNSHQIVHLLKRTGRTLTKISGIPRSQGGAQSAGRSAVWLDNSTVLVGGRFGDELVASWMWIIDIVDDELVVRGAPDVDARSSVVQLVKSGQNVAAVYNTFVGLYSYTGGVLTRTHEWNYGTSVTGCSLRDDRLLIGGQQLYVFNSVSENWEEVPVSTSNTSLPGRQCDLHPTDSLFVDSPASGQLSVIAEDGKFLPRSQVLDVGGTVGSLVPSPAGDLLAVALTGTAANRLQVFDRQNGEFSPYGVDVQPGTSIATHTGLAWSHDGSYLIVGSSSAPRLGFYENTGTGLTRLPDPVVQPNAAVTCVAWADDNVYSACGQGNSAPRLRLYKRVGSSFNEVTNIDVLPTSAVKALLWIGDYLLVATASAPFLWVYERDGDSFSVLATQPNYPTSAVVSFALSVSETHGTEVYMSTTTTSVPTFCYTFDNGLLTTIAEPPFALRSGVYVASASDGSRVAQIGSHLSVLQRDVEGYWVPQVVEDSAQLTSPSCAPAFGVQGWTAVAQTSGVNIYGETISGYSTDLSVQPLLNNVSAVSISHDGKYMLASHVANLGQLLTAYEQRTPYRWTKLSRGVDQPSQPITGWKNIAWSKDDNYVAVVGNAGYAAIYRNNWDGSFTIFYEQTFAGVGVCVDWSHDSKMVVLAFMGSLASRLTVLSLDNDDQVSVLPLPDILPVANVEAVAFTGDDCIIVKSSRNQIESYLLDENNRPIKTMWNYTGSSSTQTFSYRGGRMVAGFSTNLHVFEYQGGGFFSEPSITESIFASTSASIELTPDGAFVVDYSSVDQRVIKIDGEPIDYTVSNTDLRGHVGCVSPDQQMVIRFESDLRTPVVFLQDWPFDAAHEFYVPDVEGVKKQPQLPWTGKYPSAYVRAKS